MNALNQYTDFFEANRAVIEANSTEPLNALRPQALEALCLAGRLPDRGDEGFEKTSVNDMFAPDFGVNINRLPLPADRRRIVPVRGCRTFPHCSESLSTTVSSRRRPFKAICLKVLPYVRWRMLR